MGTRLIDSFFPDVDGGELEAAVEQLLPRRGYAVHERVTYEPGQSTRALEEALGRHPGAGAITMSSREGDARPPAGLLGIRAEPDAPWEPDLVRALSGVLGGYGVAVESWSLRGQYGGAVFYAGHTIELERSDGEHGDLHVGGPSGPSGGLDETRANADFVRRWCSLTEGATLDLWPASRGRSRSWIVSRSARPSISEMLEEERERGWSRAAFGPVEESDFRDALGSLASTHASAGRWLPRVTPGAEVPFVLLDREGPLDQALVSALSQRLQAFVTAVELRGIGLPFRWLEGDGQAVETTGQEQGADALEQLWNRFSVCLGASPGVVRWPGTHRGHPLVPPTDSAR